MTSLTSTGITSQILRIRAPTFFCSPYCALNYSAENLLEKREGEE